FASYVLWNNGSGNEPFKDLGTLKAPGADGIPGQLMAQLIAAVAAAAYGFVVSLVLVRVIDAVWGFVVKPEGERAGIDVSEHGEVGFDIGPAMDEVPESRLPEPRAAVVPPDGEGRYTAVVEGAPQKDLLHAWSNLCQAGQTPPTADFSAVYPYVTTVQGNRFRFRGGDRVKMRTALLRLFSDSLGVTVRAHVED